MASDLGVHRACLCFVCGKYIDVVPLGVELDENMDKFAHLWPVIWGCTVPVYGQYMRHCKSKFDVATSGFETCFAIGSQPRCYRIPSPLLSDPKPVAIGSQPRCYRIPAPLLSDPNPFCYRIPAPSLSDPNPFCYRIPAPLLSDPSPVGAEGKTHLEPGLTSCNPILFMIGFKAG